jgi:alkanesulfonate monooxygenase SsuD/methylene tetrahydromethanopterin reductase-like flavin-dependent oxidoreductase (luciferase family)
MISSDDRADLDPRARADNHLERAIRARDAGFQMIGVGHRYSFGPASADGRGEPLTTFQFQPMPLLAAIASHLGSSIEYMTAVLVSPSLHPVQLAEDIATVDAFCHGTLRVGIGLGWLPYELEAFGVERSGRVKRFEEMLTVLKGLLSGVPVSFHGSYYDYHDATIAAHSVQPLGPPLWIGASADAAIRRAARMGDAWLMSSHTPLIELQRQRRMYLAELAQLRMPAPERQPINRVVCIANDRRLALAQAAPLLAEKYRQRKAVGWYQEAADWTENAIKDGQVHWIIGDPDDCVEQIRRVASMTNADLFNLIVPRASSHVRRMETIDLFAREVMPHFAAEIASAGAAD